MLQPGDLPDLLDVAGLLLRAVVDAERVAAGSDRRPVTGSRNQSGCSMSVRSTPRISHSPRSSRSAPPEPASWPPRHPRGGAGRQYRGERRSRRPPPPRRGRRARGSPAGGTRPRGPPGRGPARPSRRGTSGPPGGRTSRAVPDGCAHTCSGGRSAGCRGPRSSPWSSRQATPAESAWPRQSGRLRRSGPARRAAPCPGRRGPGSNRGRARPTPWPYGSCPAARCGRRRWRPASPWETDVAAGEVADHAAGAVAEPHGDLDVAGVRAADRVDLFGQAVRPPAQRVKEMTALADEARPLASLRYQLSAASGPALTK